MRDDATGTTVLPFLFAIPFDSKESMLKDDNPRVEWRLDASATLSGVDYKSQFDVPIFKTAESSPDFKLDEALFASYAKPPDEGTRARRSRHRKTTSARRRRPVYISSGAQMESPPWPSTLFWIVWFGFVWLMIHA